MTQSHPTNFHIFERKHILTPGESIDDWREITEAEKVQLEKSDSEWVEPEPWLKESWERHFGIDYDACYNENTGYFEACGLNNITTAEAKQIDKLGPPLGSQNTFLFGLARSRINYPKASGDGTSVEMNNTFYGNQIIEVALYANGTSASTSFRNCAKLKQIGYKNSNGKIMSPLYTINNTSPTTSFEGCSDLEIVYGGIVRNNNIDVHWSPNLTLENFQYWLSMAKNTSPITIAVHPDVYAKLTDESNEEWHRVLTDAMEKQITFASA